MIRELINPLKTGLRRCCYLTLRKEEGGRKEEYHSWNTSSHTEWWCHGILESSYGKEGCNWVFVCLCVFRNNIWNTRTAVSNFFSLVDRRRRWQQGLFLAYEPLSQMQLHARTLLPTTSAAHLWMGHRLGVVDPCTRTPSAEDVLIWISAVIWKMVLIIPSKC